MSTTDRTNVSTETELVAPVEIPADAFGPMPNRYDGAEIRVWADHDRDAVVIAVDGDTPGGQVDVLETKYDLAPVIVSLAEQGQLAEMMGDHENIEYYSAFCTALDESAKALGWVDR